MDAPAIRVLVIEDEAFTRTTFKMMLRSLCWAEVWTAADGSAALLLLETGCRPDVIICDVRMAPMDGPTFLRALRATQDRGLAEVPVIMLTAVRDKQAALETEGLAVASYLEKPVSRDGLAERIQALARRR